MFMNLSDNDYDNNITKDRNDGDNPRVHSSLFAL